MSMTREGLKEGIAQCRDRAAELEAGCLEGSSLNRSDAEVQAHAGKSRQRTEVIPEGTSE